MPNTNSDSHFDETICEFGWNHLKHYHISNSMMVSNNDLLIIIFDKIVLRMTTTTKTVINNLLIYLLWVQKFGILRALDFYVNKS